MGFQLKHWLFFSTTLGIAFSESNVLNFSLSTTTSTTTRYYKDLVGSLPSQRGKCVAITGTTSGLGYWAAIAAARKGPACLVLLNRASDRALKAEEDVKNEAAAGVVVTTITCDLSNISSVRDAASNVNRFVENFGGLDVLALNAGIMDQPDKRTVDGYDVTMQINHLSHFLLTKLLMPALHAAAAKRGDVRIVTHSSIARAGNPVNSTLYTESPPSTFGGDAASMERYHQSKLANFVFAMALNAKFAKAPEYSKFKALSAAPGISMTQLKFPKMQIPKFLEKFLEDHVLLSAPDGSCSLLTAMFASSSKSGDFFEPKYAVDGPPSQVVFEGVPSKMYAAKFMGVKDDLYCSSEYADQVWTASEIGLGEKFIIGKPVNLIV